MKRRSLLGLFATAPAMAAAASKVMAEPVKKAGGRRLSCKDDDAGYREYCMARGDGQTIKVFLNGEEQKECITADESEGMVVRLVKTAKGNIAHDGGNLLEETVYGDVSIVLS